jgi:hypothetical protein
VDRRRPGTRQRPAWGHPGLHRDELETDDAWRLVLADLERRRVEAFLDVRSRVVDSAEELEGAA